MVVDMTMLPPPAFPGQRPLGQALNALQPVPNQTLPIQNQLGGTLPVQTPTTPAPESTLHKVLTASIPYGQIGKAIVSPVASLFSGGGNGNSTPSTPAAKPIWQTSSYTPEDIVHGNVDVNVFPREQVDKNGNPTGDWKKFVDLHPDIVDFVTTKRQLDKQNLMDQLTGGDRTQGMSPMAVSLLWQQAIQPQLNQITQQSQKLAGSYSGMMNNLLGSVNLPPAYKNVLQTTTPAIAAGMQNTTNALAGAAITKPESESVLNRLQQDYIAQQDRIAADRLGLLLSGGSTGSSINSGLSFGSGGIK